MATYLFTRLDSLAWYINRLVCGGSPSARVLVECKGQHNGKWEQQQHRTILDQLRIQHKCKVMGEMNEKKLLLPVFTQQGFPLYEVHQIGRAATGEPTLME